MNRYFRTVAFLAFILCVVMLRPLAPQAVAATERALPDGNGAGAAASEAWPRASIVLPIAPGVTVERRSWLGSLGWMQLTVVRVDLSSSAVVTRPVLSESSLSVPEKPTVIAESNGLLAAVNGDFFDMGATGAPLSMVAAEGRVIRSPRVDPDFASIAITRDGQAVLGHWEWVGELASMDGSFTLPLAGLNEVSVPPDSAVLYTEEWTWSKVPDHADAGHIAIGDGIVMCVVPGYPFTAPSTYVVARGEAWRQLRQIEPGQEVVIRSELRPGFTRLEAAFSGKPVLVLDGEPAPDLARHATIGAAYPAPRSAAGITADGRTLILAVVDGRAQGARGATLEEMAHIMIELGAVSALNLDGGASSAVVVRDPISGALQLANRPSAGAERPVPYVVGVLPAMAEDGRAGGGETAGGEAAGEYEAGGQAVHGQPPGESSALDMHTDMDSGLGSGWSSAPSFIAVQVDAGDSVHVVPSLARAVADSVDFFTGDEIVCASGIPLQLKVVAFDSSMKRIPLQRAAKTVDAEYVEQEGGNSAQGESGARDVPADHDAMGSDVAAAAEAAFEHSEETQRTGGAEYLGIPGGPVWTVLHPKNLRHDGAAHVDAVWHPSADGTEVIFSPLPGSRTEITVVWEMPDGTRTNTVTFAVRCLPGSPAAPLGVLGEPAWTILDDFESGRPWSAASSSPEVLAAVSFVNAAPHAAAADRVIEALPQYPSGTALSLKFDFSSHEVTRAAYARPIRPIPLPPGTEAIGLWAWSDGNGHWLRATVTDSEGVKHPLDLARMDWLGWKFVTAALPDSLPESWLMGEVYLTQVYLVEFKPELSSAGAISFDGLSALAPAAQLVEESAQSDEDGLLLGLADPGATGTVITLDASEPIPWPLLRAELESFKLSDELELTVVLRDGSAVARPGLPVPVGQLSLAIGGSFDDAVAAELLLEMLADCVDGSTRVTLVQEDAASSKAGEARALYKGVLLIWRPGPEAVEESARGHGGQSGRSDQ